MRALGARVGARRANALAARIEQQLAAISGPASPAALDRKHCSSSGASRARLRRIEASGGYGFLHDMLEIAGGTDVLGDIKRESVQMSTETILRARRR